MSTGGTKPRVTQPWARISQRLRRNFPGSTGGYSLPRSDNWYRRFLFVRGAVNDHSRDTLAVKIGITEHHLRRLAPFVIQLQVVFPGEADPAMYLHAAVPNFSISVRAIGLRYRNGAARLRGALGQGPRRVIGRRTRALRHQQHIGALVLDSLKGTDGTAELLSRLSVFDSRVEYPLHTSDHLRAERHSCNLKRLRKRAACVTIGPEGFRLSDADLIERHF